MNFVPSSEKAKEWGISQRRVAIFYVKKAVFQELN